MSDLSEEQKAVVRGMIDNELRYHKRGSFGVLSFLLVLVLILGTAFYIWVNPNLFDLRQWGSGGGGDHRGTVAQFLVRQAELASEEVRHVQRQVAELNGQVEDLAGRTTEVDSLIAKLRRTERDVERLERIARSFDTNVNRVAQAVASNGRVQQVIASKVGSQAIQSGSVSCGHAYRPTAEGWEVAIEKTVSFDVPFSQAPRIFLSPRKTEAYFRKPSLIIAYEAVEVTNNKFDLQIRTANAESLADCEIDWIAFASPG